MGRRVASSISTSPELLYACSIEHGPVAVFFVRKHYKVFIFSQYGGHHALF
jgi:hypothetical protein